MNTVRRTAASIWSRLSAQWSRTGAASAPAPTACDRVLCLLRPSLEAVLSGNNVSLSLSFVAGVNLLLWIIRLVEARPLGLFFGSLLLVVILDAVATALGVEKKGQVTPRKSIHPSKLDQTSKRALQWLDGVRNRMVNLRTENPSQFCATTCFLIGAIWVIGSIGGALLFHILVTGILLFPMLPPIMKNIDNARSGDSDDEIGGFLPEMSPSAIEELRKADQPVESPKYPSLDFSLPADASGALRYAAGEAESSDEEVDALLKKSANRSPSIPSTDTTDSESEFLLRDASKDIPVAHTTKGKSNTSPTVAITAGWLASVMGAPKNPQPKKDDSDSEFELINTEDL